MHFIQLHFLTATN